MSSKSHNILISGGSGFIGSHMTSLLKNSGHNVHILTRSSKKANEKGFIHWDPAQGTYDSSKFVEYSAFINLAGAGVMDQSWSPEYKELIMKSRVDSTNCVRQIIEEQANPPILISASAIGHYGYRNNGKTIAADDELEEGDFLQEVTQAWESAAKKASNIVEKLVIIRIGIVLDKEEGALVEMKRGFKLGIGSYFGSGRQYYSWIHIDDLCGVFLHALENELSGVFNGVAPEPVPAKQFAQVMSKTMFGSTLVVPIPTWSAKLILGERHTVLTKGIAVSSEKIQKSGYKFKFAKLEEAMESLF